MRKSLFLIIFLFAGCSGNGGEGVAGPGDPAPQQLHVPQLLNLALSVNSATYMDGDGEVPVTALLEVADAGQDIESMTVAMSNGVSMSFNVSGLVDYATGTLSHDFGVATTEGGALSIRVQVLDAAGARSVGLTTHFVVDGDPYVWRERVAGLPNVLNDVSPNLVEVSGFVAVGDGGTIMTSDDGVTWTNEWSPTDVDLHFVTCHPNGLGIPGRCFAAGDAGTILASTDGNEAWIILFDGPDEVSLRIYHNRGPFFPDIAIGTVIETDSACILYGDLLWGPLTMVEPPELSGHRITDFASSYHWVEDDLAEQHIATVEVAVPEQAKVMVSHDLQTWVEVFVSDEQGSTYSIDGDWVSGSGGKMYASEDGINWTQHQTPATQSNLIAMVNHNGILMAHGYNVAAGLGEQVGVATSDAGETWRVFVIGSAYKPRGLAYHAGRWVSVGQSLAEPGKGAIFSTQ